MPPKTNPLRLNPLQLKTLAVLQEIARHPQLAMAEPEGDIAIQSLPHAHGDHFHIGSALVFARDASGLRNEAVWTALARKGLVRFDPSKPPAITKAGQDYDTGVAAEVLHRADH